MQLEDLLTVQQVAELAKIEVQTVYQYRLRGTIPPPEFHLGPMLLWERKTIENWLQTRPKQGRPKRIDLVRTVECTKAPEGQHYWLENGFCRWCGSVKELSKTS